MNNNFKLLNYFSGPPGPPGPPGKFQTLKPLTVT